MKAIVIKTGEIITIESDTMFIGKNYKGVVKPYYDSDIDIIKDGPDYWEKLKHQYAGMAMQGILANPETIGLEDIGVAAMAIRIANITISKLKEEEK